ILFHLGTFLSFLLYILSLFSVIALFPDWLNLLIALFLGVTTLCGIILFINRLTNKNLHYLANGDDYLSNALTTLFQLATALFVGSFLLNDQPEYVYYIVASL
ncbi:MAG: hypothetical protein PHQ33_06760, partial [Bacteroidales bacterium]|nr:hypothetical protein [Bacteroidales bacterium]